MEKIIVGAFIFIVGVAIFAGGALGTLGDGRFLLGQAGSGEKNNECAFEEKPREFAREPYYTGKIFEPHLHLPSVSKVVSSVAHRLGFPEPAWDKTLSLVHVHCLFEVENVTSAYSFHLLTKYSAKGEVAMAKRMEKRYPGEFIHFLMPTFINPWIDVEVETVRNILAKSPGLFKGLGELKMFDGRDPDDPKILKLLDLAKEYNLIVMMHPFNNHLEAVERIVEQYPEVTFLFHSMDRQSESDRAHAVDNIEWLMHLISENENVYYSLGNQLSIYGFKMEHMGTVVPKEEILPKMREEFDEVLDERIARWKERIETYPERILAGESDRWYRPHYDPEVSGLVNEFNRSFIGALSPRVQYMVAYENAERLSSRAGKER